MKGNKMDSTDFYQVATNHTMKHIDPTVQTFVVGIVFGLNTAVLLMTVARLMEWCSDPLAGKLQDRVTDLEKENDDHLDNICNLEDQIEELNTKVKSLEEELAEEQEESDELCDVINELTADINIYRKRNKSLRGKVADLREILRIEQEVEHDSDESPHKRRRVESSK